MPSQIGSDCFLLIPAYPGVLDKGLLMGCCCYCL